MKERDYELIKAFDCYGKAMVAIRFQNSAHVMTMEDWEILYGKLKSEHWKNNNRMMENRKTA